MAYTSLSGSKLRAKLGGSLNESASAPTSTFAKKQLEKLGWSEGKGLGKQEQGITTHIRVKKRENDVGLGHSVSAQAQTMWWADSCGDVLSRLSGKKKVTMTDEALFDATGGARFGMRAQRKQTGKWSRAEKEDAKAEEEATAKVEWNGTGEAKVILSKSKSKRMTAAEIEGGSDEPKLKKTRCDTTPNEKIEENSESIKKPKKSKKEKKAKKAIKNKTKH